MFTAPRSGTYNISGSLMYLYEGQSVTTHLQPDGVMSVVRLGGGYVSLLDKIRALKE